MQQWDFDVVIQAWSLKWYLVFTGNKVRMFHVNQIIKAEDAQGDTEAMFDDKSFPDTNSESNTVEESRNSSD